MLFCKLGISSIFDYQLDFCHSYELLCDVKNQEIYGTGMYFLNGFGHMHSPAHMLNWCGVRTKIYLNRNRNSSWWLEAVYSSHRAVFRWGQFSFVASGLSVPVGDLTLLSSFQLWKEEASGWHGSERLKARGRELLLFVRVHEWCVTRRRRDGIRHLQLTITVLCESSRGIYLGIFVSIR